jgi:hypothetical protein
MIANYDLMKTEIGNQMEKSKTRQTQGRILRPATGRSDEVREM